MRRRFICTIVGCKETSDRWGPEIEEMARYAGNAAASAGFAVLTGGHSGVMAAAARGAKDAGGTTLGITTTDHASSANPFIDYVLPSGMGIGRNFLTALAGDVMVALPGGTGTLTEMCFASDHARPLLSWSSWEIVPHADVVRRYDREGVSIWLRAQYARLLDTQGGPR